MTVREDALFVAKKRQCQVFEAADYLTLANKTTEGILPSVGKNAWMTAPEDSALREVVSQSFC